MSNPSQFTGVSKYFDAAQNIVLKVGSSLLIKDGALNTHWFETLLDDTQHFFLEQNKRLIIVSSGAAALGRAALGIEPSRPLRLEEKQAAVSCGQPDLISAYRTHLRKYDRSAAQILLTLEDSDNRRRYLNARSTLGTLLEHGIIPIINENDTVATAEIRVGDNDRLAARVAQMVEADLLILLSDIDGLYTADPQDSNARHIPIVGEITPEIERMAGGASSAHGTGGMVTKIQAANMATSFGCHMLLGCGKHDNPLRRMYDEQERSTIFTAQQSPHNARKLWMMNSLILQGELVIDDGAHKALQSGKSLLPAGVVRVSGNFSRGDAVMIRNAEGDEIGRGLIAYDSEDARAVIGKTSSQIEEILHYSGRTEIIHRDDLAMV